MAAPPWRATDPPTLHWNSHVARGHQWPIGHSPQSPGKAVPSRDGVALFTWQPPPDVPRTHGPSIGIHTNAVIINGPLVSLHSPQGRLCPPETEWLSSHGSPPWRATDWRTLHWNSQGNCDHQWPIGRSPQFPGKAVHSRAGVALLTWQFPPDVPRTQGPPIGIRKGTVIINGPLVTLHSPQGMLCTLETEWLYSHGSPPLTCLGLTDPPLEFARGAWSSMAHWSLSTVPRECCAL